MERKKKQERIRSSVVSEVKISGIEWDLLGKGLSFVPGPPPRHKRLAIVEDTLTTLGSLINNTWSTLQTTNLQADTSTVGFRKNTEPRSLSWKYMNPPQMTHHNTFKLNGLSDQIDLLMDSLKSRVLNRRPFNLGREHRLALRSLCDRKDVVIKQADKGGSVVLWKKKNYEDEMGRHLEDIQTYKPIQHGPTALLNAQKRSKSLVLGLYNNGGGKGLMRVPARDTFLAFESEIPNIYLLPKIHKGVDPETGTWPGRPVLSGCKAPTKPVDKIVTALLNPLLPLLKERLKDTTDLLLRLNKTNEERGPVPEGAILFSLDIVSLYPSIPQREAASLVADFFDRNAYKVGRELRSAGIFKPPTKGLLMEAILHIMRDTILTFGDKTYRQIKGTAIGASSSVAIAEIFVHEVFESRRRNLGNGPDLYFRYIDDIFGIMVGNMEDLDGFFEWTNTVHPNLKFTLEKNTSELNFLDTTIYIDSVTRRLETKAYYKPTNLHMYLHYFSDHPKKLKDSLPYSLGLRLKRINSSEDTLQNQLEDLWTFFRDRDYPMDVLEKAKRKLDSTTREQALTSKPDKEDDRDILVSTFFLGLEKP
ncbi:uncharacterized protein [Procambarus clarkii]|uniref:uncharacterized protein n=1 Tax=Procambarus clarkii TaxID=6728 RepID=UPI003743793A